MSEDRVAQAKSLLTYVDTVKGRIPYFTSDPDEWHPRLLVGLFDDLISEVERLRKPPIAGCCGGEVILRPCSIKHKPGCQLLEETP